MYCPHSSFFHLFSGDVVYHFPEGFVLFVPLHHQQIAEWNFVYHFIIGEVDGIHERCDLPQKGLVADNYSTAASQTTFLVKLTAFKKGFAEIRSIPLHNAFTTSL